MTAKPKLSTKSLIAKLRGLGKKLRPYSLVVFLLLVALLYGFLFLRVNSLSNSQPSADAVSNQVKAANLPKIDNLVVLQLQSLQDHSVSVKALFDAARNSPFNN